MFRQRTKPPALAVIIGQLRIWDRSTSHVEPALTAAYAIVSFWRASGLGLSSAFPDPLGGAEF